MHNRRNYYNYGEEEKLCTDGIEPMMNNARDGCVHDQDRQCVMQGEGYPVVTSHKQVIKTRSCGGRNNDA